MMDALFIHLVKSSGILLLFFVIYHAFLKKETFFIGTRWFLASGLLTSLLMPFITISQTVYVERAPQLTVGFETMASMPGHIITNKTFDWMTALFIIYLIGVVYFSIRLLVQLRSIESIKKKSEIIKEDNFYHVKTNSKISPFSFFRYIFYYPFQFTAYELQTILVHEKEHAKGLHSIDILLTEIVCILQWFNPIIWLYKIMVKQNLEFLADLKTCELYQDKKQYQYLMLKQLVEHQKITIANPFFNSLIKKRIVMLNQNQSKRINRIKLLAVLPLLVLFLFSFNTKEIVKFKETKNSITSNSFAPTEFISPLNQNDIEKISSGFGQAKSPFTNKMEFHKGIDLVAPIGRDVFAAAEGIISASASNKSNGNYIIIEHENGYITKYLHLNDRNVNTGENVLSGSLIGHVGSSGLSTGPHLHFEILKSGKSINPQSLVPFKSPQKTLIPKKTIDEVISKEETIELIISKTTTDEELKSIKQDLASKNIDFSYTVVHNDNKEIIDISLSLSGNNSEGEKFSGNYNSSSDKPINDIHIIYDDEANMVSFGNARMKNIRVIQNENGNTTVWSGMDEIGEHEDIIIKRADGSKSVWVNSDTDDMETIEIKTVDGIKKVFIDGEETDVDEISQNHFSFSNDEDHDIRVKVISKDGKKKHKKHKGKKYKKNSENIFILKDSDDHTDVEVINEDSFFFIDTDAKEKPLFIIDGKESSKKEVKKLNSKNIATIDVSKGEAARKKYGKKGENGVVEIITKKNH